MISNTAFPNVLAMCSSLLAVIALSVVARKLGGEIGTMVKLLVVGVFLAVFLHAGAELAQVAGLLGEGHLMVVMGALLTLGSVSLCCAAWVGWRALR